MNQTYIPSGETVRNAIVVMLLLSLAMLINIGIRQDTINTAANQAKEKSEKLLSLTAVIGEQLKNIESVEKQVSAPSRYDYDGLLSKETCVEICKGQSIGWDMIFSRFTTDEEYPSNFSVTLVVASMAKHKIVPHYPPLIATRPNLTAAVIRTIEASRDD